jgi:ParB family chromosome partitioning protein
VGFDGEQVQQVPLSQVHPCPLQPRKQFAAESLQELADSIRENGIVQPLIVRQGAAGLELIAGERRWRAAQMAALSTVPVIVREADDRAVLELALIENLQRENLNPMEEAQGYAQLVGQFELTQDDVAKRVGKSRAAVANALRLLRLEPSIQSLIREGRLSVGHAKVILGLADPLQQAQAAERVVKEALNVRQTEGLVARLQKPADQAPKSQLPTRTDAHVAHLEGRIRERVGTKVRLSYKAGKGSVEISFFSDDELERLLQLLGVQAG